jgi:WD40 repeat protein
MRCDADKGRHRRLASAAADRTLRVWDILTGETLALLRGHTDIVTKVSWFPDGETLFSCSRDARYIFIIMFTDF